MRKALIQPPAPLAQPAARITLFINSPRYLITESHWLNLPFIGLQQSLDVGLQLASIRALLLPNACTLLMCRASLERVGLDSLVLDEPMLIAGNPAWGEINLGRDALGVRLKAGGLGQKMLYFSCVPDQCLNNDAYIPSREPGWDQLLRQYLDALVGTGFFPAGTWGYPAVQTAQNIAPRVVIESITALDADVQATVTTVTPHLVPDGGVCRISIYPFASKQMPVNQLWRTSKVSDTVLEILNFPPPDGDITTYRGGKLRNQTRKIMPYSQWSMTIPGTRRRGDFGVPCSWEILEPEYAAVLSPSCYAMGILKNKHCYQTKARIFRDSNLECTIRWFPVPPATPFLPVPHLWGGRPWRYEPTPPTVGPGELLEYPISYDKGAAPEDWNPWLGSDDWWSNGAPVAALGNPGIVEVRDEGQCGVFIKKNRVSFFLGVSGTIATGITTQCCGAIPIPPVLYLSFKYSGTIFSGFPAGQWHGLSIPLNYTSSLTIAGHTGRGWFASGSYVNSVPETVYYRLYVVCGFDFPGYLPGVWYVITDWGYTPLGSGGDTFNAYPVSSAVCSPFRLSVTVPEVGLDGSGGVFGTTYFMTATPGPIEYVEVDFKLTVNGVVRRETVAGQIGFTLGVDEATRRETVAGETDLALGVDGEASQVTLDAQVDLALGVDGEASQVTLDAQVDLALGVDGQGVGLGLGDGEVDLTLGVSGTGSGFPTATGEVDLTLGVSGTGSGFPTATGQIALALGLKVAKGQQVVLLSTGSSFTKPADWNDAANDIYCIGGGGGGGTGALNAAIGAGGGGGGGGECSHYPNLNLTSISTVPYQLGVGGGIHTAGGDTWFGSATQSLAYLSAAGGGAGSDGSGARSGSGQGAGGAGGSSTAHSGAVQFAGGNGGTSATGASGGAGGGGAGGPNGVGGNGAGGSGANGGGGGGADGGANAAGGNGGNGFGGTGGGAAGSPGANGSNGGGGGGAISAAGPTASAGGNNSLDGLWVRTSDGLTYGMGSGAGGGATLTGSGTQGGNGGVGATDSFGGGGGGGAGAIATAGLGRNAKAGVIVIVYTPIPL
jgi:hypothetical protein